MPPKDKEVKDESGEFVLDLSFGETSHQYDKVSLLGSSLPEDIRGNNLDATFGWNLIKAMRKRVHSLDFCNGVNLKQIRENQVTDLNLANFSNHCGLYGIEVVGAIFLAHILRYNESVKSINFKRNDVTKEGAKALAQGLISNPNSPLEYVNCMGRNKIGPVDGVTGAEGINFRRFRMNDIQEVILSNRNLDDDDIVFLEEWMLRFDCVTHLNLSHNNFGPAGLRKIIRRLSTSQSLKSINLSGVPMGLDELAVVLKGIKANGEAGGKLEEIILPLESCTLGRWTPEKWSVLVSLVEICLAHPTLKSIGKMQINLDDFRKFAHGVDKISNERPPKDLEVFNGPSFMVAYPWAEVIFYMALIAETRPRCMKEIKFGSTGAAQSGASGPSVSPYPAYFLPILSHLVSSVAPSLVSVTIALPPKAPCTHSLLLGLTEAKQLTHLSLLGYASCELLPSELFDSPPGYEPPELPDAPEGAFWGSRWPLYLCLTQLVRTCPRLQNVCSIDLTVNDEADSTLLLALECMPGISVNVSSRGAAGTVAIGQITQLDIDVADSANVDLLYTVLSAHSRVLTLKLNFFAKSPSLTELQGDRFAAHFTSTWNLKISAHSSTASPSGPSPLTTPHRFHIQTRHDSIRFLVCAGMIPPLSINPDLLPVVESISVRRIDGLNGRVLRILHAAFGNGQFFDTASNTAFGVNPVALPSTGYCLLKQIKLLPRLHVDRYMRKQWSATDIQILFELKDAMVKSPHFIELVSDELGSLPRNELQSSSDIASELFLNFCSGFSPLECPPQEAPVSAVSAVLTSSRIWPDVSASSGGGGGVHSKAILSLPTRRLELPLAENLVVLNLCMSGLKAIIADMHPHEFAATSARLWQATQPRQLNANEAMRPSPSPRHLHALLAGGADEHPAVPDASYLEEAQEESDFNLPGQSGAGHFRWHWRHGLKIGQVAWIEETRYANATNKQAVKQHNLGVQRKKFSLATRSFINESHEDGSNILGLNTNESVNLPPPIDPTIAHKSFFHSILESLIRSPSLQSLDLRGNYLSEEDAEILLGALPENRTLRRLNDIPISRDDARRTEHLALTGLSFMSPQEEKNILEEEQDRLGGVGGGRYGRRKGGGGARGDDPVERLYGVAALESKAGLVRIDAGDAAFYASIIDHINFPSLRSMEISRLEILDRSALLMSKVLAPPGSDEEANESGTSSFQPLDVSISEVRMSVAATKAFIQAITDNTLTGGIRTLNFFPTRAAVLSSSPLALQDDNNQQQAGGKRTREFLNDPSVADVVSGSCFVTWNDFTLGVCHAAGFFDPNNPANFLLRGGSASAQLGSALFAPQLKMRCGAISEIGASALGALMSSVNVMSPSISPLATNTCPVSLSRLRHLDLSHSFYLDDIGFAQLTRHLITAMAPTSALAANLPTSSACALQSLNVRFCPLLRERSALELIRLIQMGGNSLRSVNGVDLATLHLAAQLVDSFLSKGGAGQDATAAVLASVPPLLIRTSPSPRRLLTECDSLFFALLVHHFPHIPYIHVHVELPSSVGQKPIQPPMTAKPFFFDAPSSRWPSSTLSSLPPPVRVEALLGSDSSRSSVLFSSQSTPEEVPVMPPVHHRSSDQFLIAGVPPMYPLLAATSPSQPSLHSVVPLGAQVAVSTPTDALYANSHSIRRHIDSSSSSVEIPSIGQEVTVLERVALMFSACPVTTQVRLSIGPYVPSATIPKVGGRKSNQHFDENDEEGSSRKGGKKNAKIMPPVFTEEDEILEVVYSKPQDSDSNNNENFDQFEKQQNQNNNAQNINNTSTTILAFAMKRRRDFAALRHTRLLEKYGKNAKNISSSGNRSSTAPLLHTPASCWGAHPVVRSGNMSRQILEELDEILMRRGLYVNDINDQQQHNFLYSVHGADGSDLLPSDILHASRHAAARSTMLTHSNSALNKIAAVSSLDIQFAQVGPEHIKSIFNLSDSDSLSTSNGSITVNAYSGGVPDSLLLESSNNSSGRANLSLPPLIPSSVLANCALGPRSNALMAGLSGLSLKSAGQRLQHVCLSNNRLGDDGVQALLSGLLKIGAPVKHLALAHNDVGDIGAQSLSQVILSQALPTLTSVDLSSNLIKEHGGSALADALSGGLLTQLNLMKSGTSGIAKLPPHLILLTDEVVSPMPILSLDLSHNYVQEAGALAFAEVLGAFATLSATYDGGELEMQLNDFQMLPAGGLPSDFEIPNLSLELLSLAANRIGPSVGALKGLDPQNRDKNNQHDNSSGSYSGSTSHACLALVAATSGVDSLAVLNLSLNEITFPSSLHTQLPVFRVSTIADGIFVKEGDEPYAAEDEENNIQLEGVYDSDNTGEANKHLNDDRKLNTASLEGNKNLLPSGVYGQERKWDNHIALMNGNINNNSKNTNLISQQQQNLQRVPKGIQDMGARLSH